MPLSLIVSPVRSWPLDQGNRTRILTLGSMLKERGHTVHFLLSCLEGNPSGVELAVMESQWDLVHSVPYLHSRQQSYADAWGADDWYDPAVDAAISDLTRIWSYDLCLVNYSWYSKAFEALPDNVVRVVDTHDAFGDRHKRLYAAGTTPVWYYTRPDDEGLCLDRADIVLAIQEEEQAWFQSLSDQPVQTVGHVLPPVFLPPRERTEGKLRAGYLASANPSNQQSIISLLRHWFAHPVLAEHVELHIAGPICNVLSQVPSFVVKRGYVENVQDFYASVDFSVNPNIGGSGLKIKSVEALSYGRPIFATAEGMLGICAPVRPYVSPSVPTMVEDIVLALKSDPQLEAARAWARKLFMDYRRRHIGAFEDVLATAQSHPRRGTSRFVEMRR